MKSLAPNIDFYVDEGKTEFKDGNWNVYVYYLTGDLTTVTDKIIIDGLMGRPTGKPTRAN